MQGQSDGVKTSQDGSFWDHLEELRQRLLIILGVLAVSTLGTFLISRTLMELVVSRGPATLLALAPSEALVAHLKLSLIAGMLISSPVIFVQLWRFIAPGLLEKERRFAIAAALVCTLLFLGGALFSWFLMLRPVISVFQSFEGGRIQGGWSVSNYIGFLGRFVLVFGAAFQLPVLILLLTRMGIISPSTISRYRRHVIIGLLVTGAILTPPDPLTQVLLALPLYVLFELSVLLARAFTARERDRGGTEEVA